MNKIGRLLHFARLRSSKLHTSANRFEGKPVVPKPTPEAPPVVDTDIGKSFLTPNAMDKFILVWAKKYKSKAEIPNLVPTNIYNHARNVARIKLANYTIVAVIFGCILAVYSGKQEQKLGNTLQKRTLDWHEELRKEHEREMQEKAALANKK